MAPHKALKTGAGTSAGDAERRAQWLVAAQVAIQQGRASARASMEGPAIQEPVIVDTTEVATETPAAQGEVSVEVAP